MERLFLLLFVFALCSCASPTTRRPSLSRYDIDKTRRSHVRANIRYRKERDERIGNLFYPLILNTGPELCDKKLKPSAGINFGWVKPTYKSPAFASKVQKQEYDDVKKIFKFRAPSMYVRFVYKGSAAEKAGIREADRIVSLFGVPVSQGHDVDVKFFETLHNHLKEGVPVEMEVERDGKIIPFSYLPDMVCPYKVFVDTSMHEINAYATGEEIFITAEIFDYLKDDNDLAAVMAHELGHNTMGHINSKKINIMIGTVTGFLADIFLGTYGGSEAGAKYGHLVYSPEFEDEADYVSVYYMARAGYDYKKMAAVQRKLSNRSYTSIYNDPSTHPTPQHRTLLLIETAKEIDLKKAFGHDLTPDFAKVNTHLRQKRE